MPRFEQLAINDPDALCYGRAPNPLTTRRDMVIGGGTVYPELNFTLPTMFVNEQTTNDVCRQYEQMITESLKRAAELEAPGLVIEFETLPPMTENPDWGMSVVNILLGAMEDAHAKHGLKSVLRMTPNDTREMVRPPVMRSGALWDNMLELFERSAEQGAELLSIESVGGKEVCDEALSYGDIRQVIFSLCVMGVRDMQFLWSRLNDIAQRHDVKCAGDTACGFANTAMVLAEQKMVPRVFAAVVRAVSAVRSLVAYECGAVGPGKDCAYENPILKAITGYPMAMEGKSASVAHLSPLGNIAAATCDTWSNESVQNVKLLGGMAPVCSLEQLIYDCRLFNRAASDGLTAALQMRDWLTDSDAALDPQAFILTPINALKIARAIVESPNHYAAGRAAALCAINIISNGQEAGKLRISEREAPWLDQMREMVESMPDDENEVSAQMMAEVDTTRFVANDYELAV